MKNNDDSDYIPEDSEDSDNSSKPRRCPELILEKVDSSFDSNSDSSSTSNDAGRNKSKISRSQSKKVSSLVIYQCSLCSFQTNLKPNLKRHFKACFKGVHRSRKKPRYKVTMGAKFRCEYCPSETRTLKNLLSHKKSHAKLIASGLIECTHCDLTFFTLEDCTKHMKESADVRDHKNKPLICLKCQREADSLLQLVVHRALDHIKPGCLFTCFKPNCEFKTEQRDELKGHLMDAHKLGRSLFRPLADANFEEQQTSFTCPKCFYETKKEVYLKAHHLNSHSKDSEAPFLCPWSDCQASLAHKKSLREHLKVIHSMNLTNGIDVSPDQSNGSLLSCRDCDHKSRTDIQMLIHRALKHCPRGQKQFGCPMPECASITTYRQHVRRHLKEVHKLGKEYFRDYGVEQSEEESESDDGDLVEQLDVDLENLDEVSVVDCDYEHTSLLTGTFNKRKYHCGLCVFTTKNKRPFWRHQVQVHHKRRCDVCKRIVWGKYQWFWHNYSVHNRQRGSEIYQWWLRCDLCGKEGTTKSSYKHGATHELPRVVFLTLFFNVASGYVTFHYAEYESSQNGSGNKAHTEKPKEVEETDVEDCVTSDKKGNLAKTLLQLGREEAITVEFVGDSDGEAEPHDDNGIGSPKHDDDHLINKIEFLACKECRFKTHDAALLKIHKVQVHGCENSGQKKQYRCPEDDCPFQSKYLSNLKRHLMDMHKHRSYLWRHESTNSRWRKREVNQEEEDRVIQGLESPKNLSDIEINVKHTTIDSDCEPEDDILDDDNEVIRIEVTEETEEVTGVKAATLRIKCKNEGCDYVCHDIDNIQKHAESCTKSLSHRSQSPEEFVCTLCETAFKDKDTLQNHIRNKHLIKRKAKRKLKKKLIVKRHGIFDKIPGRLSFKCQMCYMSLVYIPSLRNHTYVHARNENNFKLKVRYSKYKGDTRIGTIVIRADPKYVPRNSSNVPLHWVHTPRAIRVRSPVLDYDPELPVFACTECNFKTNREPELTRHKKLHWSEEKAAAFDAKKWFTCGVCYYHCLDAAAFKKHANKHKSRADTKIDVKKLGKDSWIF